MSNKRTPENQSKPNEKTEADIKSIDGRAGHSEKSSHDHMSNVKAGTHHGAGGGAKQEHHH